MVGYKDMDHNTVSPRSAVGSLPGLFFFAKKVSRCSVFLARVYLWMRANIFAFHGGNVMRLLIKGINQIRN